MNLSRLRDRLLSSQRFQRWALRFPLTRPVARKQSKALFDLCAGFVYSQILFACVRLGLFERLKDGPQSVDALAAAMALPTSSCLRLLEGAAALKLVERRAAGYGLGPLGAAMLGNPGVAGMVEHHHLLYADLEDPVALLRDRDRKTGLSGYWSYTRTDQTPDAASIDAYTTLMADSQSFIAEQVLDACSLRGCTSLLDVGGGDGTFARTAAERWPGLAVTVIDLPPVAERARANFEQHGLAERATVIGGDFIEDMPASGFDVISLIRVAHDHDDDVLMALLHKIRACLPANGFLLLAEPMSETPGAESAGSAYFGFYLHAMGQGESRSAKRLREMLLTAGFGRVRELGSHVPLLTNVMMATP